MQVSRDVGTTDGVRAVLVAMATPLNLELAASMGLAPAEDASPEQLLIAIRADDDAPCRPPPPRSRPRWRPASARPGPRPRYRSAPSARAWPSSPTVRP